MFFIKRPPEIHVQYHVHCTFTLKRTCAFAELAKENFDLNYLVMVDSTSHNQLATFHAHRTIIQDYM